MDSAAIRQLIDGLALDCPDAVVTLRETHISWVILQGEFAYKIKKPVNFGFLDYSELEQRRHFCEQELRLNRRFAPELYLGVVPLTGDSRGPKLEGDGPVIGYAVKMHRFDEDQLLQRIAASGRLTPALLRSLGRELARLHGELAVWHPVAGTDTGTPAALLAAMKQNFQQVRQYPLGAEGEAQLDAVEHWFLGRYQALLPVLQQRVLDGWVIDGHGDAHLGNIALVDGAVRLFDCIEFNPALRIMDSIAEIGLLCMDLEARGHPGEAHRLLTDYLEYRGDYAGLALLDLYRCYYAMVRAKVNLLREAADSGAIRNTRSWAEFLRYLALASDCSRKKPVFLAITHGVSGTGKSTIAAGLVAQSGAVRIRSDVERKRLFGLAPEQRSGPRDRASLYSGDMSRRTFGQLQQLAREILAAGYPVIVDATFLHRKVRDDFRALAGELQVPFAIIDCSATPVQLRQRLVERERRRQDASEADVAVMEKQLAADQPVTGEELAYRLQTDSNEFPAALWRRFRQRFFP